MKKHIILFSALAVTALTGAALTKSMVSAKAMMGDYSNPDYAFCPASGEVSADSYVTPIWTSLVGATRINENKVAVTDVSSWGYRAQIPGRTFDLTSFYATFDFEGITNNNAVMLIFGSAPGSYSTENTKLLTIDFVKDTTTNTLYQSVVSTTLHNTSIPSYTDGQQWKDDANYTGVQVQSENNKVSISIKKDNNVTSTITVNGVETVVQNEELYEKCTDGTKAYFAIGLVNSAFGEQKYIIEDIGDDSDKLYKSNAGDFGKVKSTLTTLSAEDFTSYTVEETLQAKKQFDEMPYKKLYSYDRAYFSSQYNQVKEKVDEAVIRAGSAINLMLLQENVEELEDLASMSTTEEIDRALELKSASETIVIDLSDDELTTEQQTQYDNLVARLETACNKIVPAMKAAYVQAIGAYEAAVAATYTSGAQYVQANKLRNAIPTKYNQYLSEADVETFAERINAANAASSAQVRFEHNNWIQGSNADVVKKADNSIDLVSYGGFVGTAPEASSALFNKELVSVRDFEMEFSVEKISTSVGGWISIGIMENTAPFITAEDSSVQQNKGIFFLITRTNSQELGVQAFIMTLTCNRFYDAPLTQNISIPMAQNIKLSFKEVTKTIAGVSATYFEMKFNDITFDQESITVNKIKTSLESREGHLFIGSSGASIGDPDIINIKSINGYAPLSESIKKTIAVEAPTSTSTEGSFEEGKTTGTVVFNLDTHNESLKSVTVNGQKLQSTNYSYSNNKLTLKAAYLKTLKAGDYVVIATTDGGSVTWTLHITSAGGGTSESEEGGETEGKKGCGGSIIATSAILSVVAGLGIALTSLKKKEN